MKKRFSKLELILVGIIIFLFFYFFGIKALNLLENNRVFEKTSYNKVMPVGFVGNIEELTLANNNFRQVIYTAQHEQLVLMSLKPGEDIGMEVHATTDQFLRIEKGEGKVILNGEEHLIKDGSAIVVPAGTEHNVINTSLKNPLKLYTVYSPPHHKDGTIHKTKQDALNDSEDHL